MWVQHVRRFAAENNLTYGCALSDPRCKETYKPITNYNPQLNKLVNLVKISNAGRQPTRLKVEKARDAFNVLRPLIVGLPASDKRSEYMARLGSIKNRIVMLKNMYDQAAPKFEKLEENLPSKEPVKKVSIKPRPKKAVKWDAVQKKGFVTIAPEVQFQKLEENEPSIEPVKKKISIKPRPKAPKEAAKKAPAPKKAPKKAAAPKASDILPVEAIVSEWDTPQIPIVLAQSEHRNIIDKIETLADKGSYVIPADLFSLNKKLLGELYKKYSIKQIDDVMVEIIEHIGGKTVAGEYTRYEKSMPSVRQKKKLAAEISTFK